MPTVATYGGRKVQTDLLPGVRKTAAETPLSEGAGLAEAEAGRGQALAGVGATLGKLGSHALALVDEQRKQANDIAALGAHTSLASFVNQNLYDPSKGWLTESGNGSFDLPERAGAAFNEQADKISAGLGNDEQRLTFARTRALQGQDLDLQLRRHVFGEMQKNDAATVQASVDVSRNAAISNALDPARVALELDHQVATIQGFAQRRHLSADVTAQMVNDARSKTHVGVIEQMLADEQPKAASVYFDEMRQAGQINGDQIARIEKALEEGSLRKQSQSISDQILAGTYGLRASGEPKGEGYFGALKRPDGQFSSELSIGVEIDGKEMEIPSLVPTLTGAEVKQMLALKDGEEPPRAVIAKAIAYARERLAAGKPVFAAAGEKTAALPEGTERATPERPGPPDSLTKALEQAKVIDDPKLRDEVERRIEHAFQVKDAAQRQADEVASKDAFTAIENAPTHSTDAIPPTAWQSFSGPLRSALRAYGEKLRKGEDLDTDWPTYYAALKRAADDPTTFAQENLLGMRAKLSDSDFKHLAEIQLSIRGKKPEHPDVLEFRTKDQILNDSLSRYGFETRDSKQSKEEANAVAQLRHMVDDQLVSLSTLTGKKPSNPDIQKVVDGILSQKREVPGSWWGLVPFNGVSLSTTSKPIINLTIKDVPDADRKQIEQALTQAHRPIDDQSVLQLYIDTVNRLNNRKQP